MKHKAKVNFKILFDAIGAFSSLCLLIGTNSRYEGSSLNLKLRQRYFKGNFKFISIGSFLNLTFPVSFLGSNLLILKNISLKN